MEKLIGRSRRFCLCTDQTIKMLIKLQTKEISALPHNVKLLLKSLVDLFVHTLKSQRRGTIRDLLLRCYFSDILWSSIVCFCVLVKLTWTSQNVSCFYLWKRDLILKMNKIQNNQDAEKDIGNGSHPYTQSLNRGKVLRDVKQDVFVSGWSTWM